MQGSGKRKFNRIDYCNQTRQLNIAKKKGNQQETASLNINLKTINKNYLNQFLDDEHSQEERQIINDYILKDKGNFKSTRKLFGAIKAEHQSGQSYERIRTFMLRNYSGTGFIRKVFGNEKMDFKSKLIFIKFLEKIRMSALAPNQHSFWKERF